MPNLPGPDPWIVIPPLPWRGFGSGDGVSVAVLDSGIWRSHPVFRGAAVSSARSFVGGDPMDDAVGHGTECCSLLLGQPGLPPVVGIAPQLELHVGQVIGPEGRGTQAAMRDALQWVIDIGTDIVAIPSGRISPDHVLESRITEAVAAGMIFVAAAGNPYAGQRGPLYPAAYESVISVGCSCYSQIYREWAIPPNVVTLTDEFAVAMLGGGWRYTRGTSQATMVVCGFLALALARFGRNRVVTWSRKINDADIASCITSAFG